MRLLTGILTGFLMIALCSGTPKTSSKNIQTYVSNYENVLGTSLQIKVFAGSETDAATAENNAMNEIDRLDHIISGYNQQSEFNRWMNAPQHPVAVSPELFEVLNLFDK